MYASCLWVVVLGHFSFALVFVECSFFSILDLLSNDKQQIKPHNGEHLWLITNRVTSIMKIPVISQLHSWGQEYVMQHTYDCLHQNYSNCFNCLLLLVLTWYLIIIIMNLIKSIKKLLMYICRKLRMKK